MGNTASKWVWTIDLDVDIQRYCALLGREVPVDADSRREMLYPSDGLKWSNGPNPPTESNLWQNLDALFTEAMYGHLDLQNYLAKIRLDSSAPAFPLTLAQYFDDPPIKVWVKLLIASEDTYAVFPLVRDGQRSLMVWQEVLNPRLVPDENRFNEMEEEFRATLSRWFECVEACHDLDWHEVFFGSGHGNGWPQALLKRICKFYHGIGPDASDALRYALRATVLAYILGHSFYVPEEDIKAVLDYSGMGAQHTGAFQYVVPRMVSQFFKLLVLPYFRAILSLAVKDFQDLCESKSSSQHQTDEIFATAAVLLMVFGMQQGKAVEIALSRCERDEDFPQEVVYQQILAIETVLVGPILEAVENHLMALGHDRTSVRGSPLTWFEKALHPHCNTLRSWFWPSTNSTAVAHDREANLPDFIHPDTFGPANTNRLMQRLANTVSKTRTQRLGLLYWMWKGRVLVFGVSIALGVLLAVVVLHDFPSIFPPGGGHRSVIVMSQWWIYLVACLPSTFIAIGMWQTKVWRQKRARGSVDEESPLLPDEKQVAGRTVPQDADTTSDSDIRRSSVCKT